MDPTCGLADKIRDLVWDLIWKHLLYLVHYRRNIEQLKGRLDDLNRERIALQHRIDEAKNNGEEIEENVLHWLHEVDKILEQVPPLHRESEAKLDCGITSCPNPWLRCKLSKRAKTTAQEAVEFVKRNFARVGYHLPLPLMPELTNKEGNEGIDSRFPIVYQIIEELRTPGVNMIGLCGLGGVGKTTIAKEVAKNQKIFEKVIMVTVSQEWNIEKIQDQIAEKLSMQLSANNKEVRAFRLCERLKKEENMLLILDDLWEELDLGMIGIHFASGENYSKKNEGCKILLTSRNKTLMSDRMKCQKIVEVGVLSEDEALELFKKIVVLSTDSSSSSRPELISIATDIVRKCGGLPLAIATTAKTLRNKDINEWRDALARLNNPFRRNNTLTRDVDTILKWSYDHLSSSEYKNIFLLAAMLSHDPSIDDLLMYSVGLDILDGIENMEDARVGVSVTVSKLKSLNLFLDSISSHHVTIHDVFRDVALPIASKELHAFIRRRLKEWPDENILQGFEGICLQESDISDLPEELNGPRLQFFLLNSTKHDLNIPNMFFKSSKELKVLAFTNVHFSSLSSLIFLHKLKALCLHSCLLEDITEVRSLKNLKVLSLANSEIQQLPIELAELTSLQLLNLSHCSKLKVIPQKLLSSLKKLEVLYMGNSFDQWKVEESSKADQNASLDELMDLPISSLEIHIPTLSILPGNLFLKMNLRRYIIFIGERWTWQSNYEASKILKLELESSIDLTAGLQNLSKGVEDLHFYGSNGQENVLYNLDASGFPCLRHLRIESNDDIKYIVLNSAHHEHAFPILESLELENLKALENLCEGLNDIVFGQLHTLKMENLPALTGDFSIKDRATKNASNKIFKSLFNKVLLPKLEILELSKLNSLIPLIWNDQFLHNSFDNLKTLTVKKCGFVKLVPLHVLKSLNNLEELDVKDCDMLEKVFDFKDLTDYYKDMDSSSEVVPLKKLNLKNLPKLKNVWSNHYQGNFSFSSLRSVDVCNCGNLTSIFPVTIAKGMLCDLEELQISNCSIDVIVAKDQVSESVPVTFGFPRLTSLKLYGLPNLRNFYPQKHILEWPHLNQLSIEGCDELKIFEKEVSSSSKIYEEENMLDSKYPLLSHDKVIGNLKRLTLQGKEVENIGAGLIFMYELLRFEMLHNLWDRPPNLRELQLSGDFEKALGGDNVAALAACFPKLTLQNFFLMGSLSPSLVSPNLTCLNVSCCVELVTLMTSSIARSLIHLTHLSVGFCLDMEEIITKQEGEDDEDKEIFFKKLEFLELTYLPRLRRFCSHNYTFRFPLLDKLVIRYCPKFKRFSPRLVNTPALKSVQLSQDLGKPLEIWDTNLNKTFDQQDDQLLHNSFNNLRTLILGGCNFMKSVPLHVLKYLNNLEKFEIKYCDKLEMVFGFEDLNDCHKEIESSSVFVPLSLTHLEVRWCHGLTTLMTSSAAPSLVHITHLSISDCNQIEEIITKKEGEDDEDKEIFFNKMKFLELDELPRLKRFCGYNYTFKFLSLEHVIITECPWLMMFCPRAIHAPRLQSVQVDKYDARKDIWMTDLNNTIQHLFTFEEVISTTHSMVINAKNITRIVDVFPNVNSLYIESFTDEGVTFPHSSLGKFPKLDELHVEHCSFEEILPSRDQITNFMGKISSSASFQNLTKLFVSRCHKLIHLVTTSSAKSLVSLGRLDINDCKRMEEIIMNDTNEDVQGGITFNRLYSIKLTDMPSLKMFSPQNHTFKFPELEDIEISGCPEMKRFCLGVLKTPKLSKVKIEEHDMEWKDEEDLNETMEGLSSAKDSINI